MTKKTIFIKKLTFGYTVESDRITRAVENAEALQKWISSIFDTATERLKDKGVNDMLISIEVDENIPTCTN